MPCTKCKEGKYKWGKTGECEYDSLDACEQANHKYEMKPTPLGQKTYEEYAKELGVDVPKELEAANDMVIEARGEFKNGRSSKWFKDINSL